MVNILCACFANTAMTKYAFDHDDGPNENWEEKGGHQGGEADPCIPLLIPLPVILNPKSCC